MKYLIFSGTTPTGITQEVPFVFPNVLVHCMVAEQMRHLLETTHCLKDLKVVGAGEVSVRFGNCSGEATSFKPLIPSRGKEDRATLIINDYTGGLL